MQIFLIAVSLALDAMAVSISVGLAHPAQAARQGLRLGLWFGGFQFGMPLLGFLLGRTLSAYIESVAPWVAFALLAFIGGRMIWESFQPGEAEDFQVLPTGQVCLLAIATSIDALAVGVSLAALGVDILPAAGTIAGVTFCCTFLGDRLGQKCGPALGSRAQLLGGGMLILIGVKIFLEHLLR